MKKSIQIIATALVMLFGNSAVGQNDTMYVMKNGYITHSILVDYNHVDSIIFYKPVELATLTTTKISSITETTALSGGNISNNGGGEITSRGICWGTSPNPTKTDNLSANGSGAGSFISNLSGLTKNTSYYLRAYATNSAGTAYGKEVSFITANLLKDVDGNVYTSVTIGTQEWMSENLRTTKYSDGTAIPNVTGNTQWKALLTGAWSHYDNDNQYDTIYGKLYNWYAVETGKLCPTGWHVPTDAEWTVLTKHLAADGHSGDFKATVLKSTSGWNEDGNGTDNYGWLGLPGGYRYSNGFDDIGFNGYWWSSSQDDTYSAWHRSSGGSSGSVYRYDSYKYYGISVRCLRD
jgi:uncharacterized protein (TIGR02145 family)